MGDEQRVRHDQLLRDARERFEAGTDFTVAVEEEFALLDPASLDLVNRFEDVQAAAAGTPAEPHLVGELIASEAEIKTGRCRDLRRRARHDRRAPRAARRRSSSRSGSTLGATGTHPWANWKDQRIIDTPHYRRNDELLRYVVWKNNTFGFHVHVGIRGADRAIAVTTRCATGCPSCSRSRPARRSPRASTPGCIRRGRRSSRASSRAAACPTRSTRWADYERYVRFLYDTGSITEHTQLWWSVRPHLAFPTVEIRICDGQPELAESQSLAALCVALAARIARAIDEGEPIVQQPHRLIEENMWRAIRYGLSGELIDLERGDVLPARARIERLIEWVLPVAEEIGAADWLASRSRTRRSARSRGSRRARPRRDLRRAGRAPVAGRLSGRETRSPAGSVERRRSLCYIIPRADPVSALSL